MDIKTENFTVWLVEHSRTHLHSFRLYNTSELTLEKLSLGYNLIVEYSNKHPKLESKLNCIIPNIMTNSDAEAAAAPLILGAARVPKQTNTENQLGKTKQNSITMCQMQSWHSYQTMKFQI